MPPFQILPLKITKRAGHQPTLIFLNFFQDLPAFFWKIFPICSFLQDTADMTNRAQEHFNISQSLDKQSKVRAISCQVLDNFNYHSAANYLHFIHNSAASIVNKRLIRELIYLLFIHKVTASIVNKRLKREFVNDSFVNNLLRRHHCFLILYS